MVFTGVYNGFQGSRSPVVLAAPPLGDEIRLPSRKPTFVRYTPLPTTEDRIFGPPPQTSIPSCPTHFRPRRTGNVSAERQTKRKEGRGGGRRGTGRLKYRRSLRSMLGREILREGSRGGSIECRETRGRRRRGEWDMTFTTRRKNDTGIVDRVTVPIAPRRSSEQCPLLGPVEDNREEVTTNSRSSRKHPQKHLDHRVGHTPSQGHRRREEVQSREDVHRLSDT